MIEREDDFSEFPQDRCEACGELSKDEARDDLCDICLQREASPDVEQENAA